MKPEFQKLMEVLGRKGCINILFNLKDSPKRWKDLDEVVKDKRALSYRIKELLNLGIIQLTILEDTPTGSKAYKLSPLGKKILKHIEEMQKEFEEWHYEPETDEEYLEGNWRRD